LAFGLQLFPLLGAGSCVVSGLAYQRSVVRLESGDATLVLCLWFAVLLWGFGYLYLGRWIRFLLAFFLGPLLAFGSCVGLLRTVKTYPPVGVDQVVPSWDPAELLRASLLIAAIVALTALSTAVDAARLAGAGFLRRIGVRRASSPDEGSAAGSD
jgi:hypothetical protein